MRKRFDLDGSYPYYDILIDQFSGKNDSWGILWGYAVFSVGGLILYIRRTLVSNNGLMGRGHMWIFNGPYWTPKKDRF